MSNIRKVLFAGTTDVKDVFLTFKGPPLSEYVKIALSYPSFERINNLSSPLYQFHMPNKRARSVECQIILKDTSNKRGESVTYVDSSSNQAHVLLKHSIFECYIVGTTDERTGSVIKKVKRNVLLNSVSQLSNLETDRCNNENKKNRYINFV